MPKITLDIGNIPYNLLNKFANKNGISPEQYATNIIVGWLNSHIEGYFIKQLKNKTTQELIQIFGVPEP